MWQVASLRKKAFIAVLEKGIASHMYLLAKTFHHQRFIWKAVLDSGSSPGMTHLKGKVLKGKVL